MKLHLSRRACVVPAIIIASGWFLGLGVAIQAAPSQTGTDNSTVAIVNDDPPADTPPSPPTLTVKPDVPSLPASVKPLAEKPTAETPSTDKPITDQPLIIKAQPFKTQPIGSPPVKPIAATTEEPAATPKPVFKAPPPLKPAEAQTQARADEDPALEPDAPINAASLKGVQPGTSTAADVERAWGKAKQEVHKKGAIVRQYELPPFHRVDVALVNDKVASIAVLLEGGVAADTLIKQLKLTDVRPVMVPDELGSLLGESFPERGVMFSFASGTQNVSRILLEAIEPQAFLLRAETNLSTAPRRSLADLDIALSLDSKLARAHWLRARILLAAGRTDRSIKAIEKALDLDSANPDYRLTQAAVLAQAGSGAEALQALRSIVAEANLSPEIKAQAACQLGDQIAATELDFKQAMQQHLAAIKLAEPLVTDSNVSVRRAAKQVLIRANLGVAADIAQGRWQQKEKIAPQWLSRAAEQVEDLIAHDCGDLEWRLLVNRAALADCAAVQGSLDPTQWTKEAIQTGRILVNQTDDAWRRRRLQWDTGLALVDALQTDRARDQHAHALENAKATLAYLEQGSAGRQQNPDVVLALAQGNFRVGAAYAVEESDHASAIACFGRAKPFLDRLDDTSFHTEQRGPMLVSMGISYWAMNQQDEALRLTQHGADLMTEAVKLKVLDGTALAVPYGNLATMHSKLGHEDQAKDFARMAAGSSDVKRK